MLEEGNYVDRLDRLIFFPYTIDAIRAPLLVVQGANGGDALRNSQAENLLTHGVDVLLVAPHNGKTAAIIVESAHKAGVPVIVVGDAWIQGWSRPEFDRLLASAR